MARGKKESSAPVCVFCKRSGGGVMFQIFNPRFPPFGTACTECEATLPPGTVAPATVPAAIPVRRAAKRAPDPVPAQYAGSPVYAPDPVPRDYLSTSEGEWSAISGSGPVCARGDRERATRAAAQYKLDLTHGWIWDGDRGAWRQEVARG